MPIEEDHPIMEWIITHAAFCLTHFSVGHDGMTPIERLTGRKWVRPLAELGEIVMAKLAARKIGSGKKKIQKNKLAPRSIKAIWVGQIARTGEHIVVKPNGDAVKCRTIRRVPIEERWRVEDVLKITATPRRPAPSQADEGDIKAKLADEEASAEKEQPSRRKEDVKRKHDEAADEDTGANLQAPQARDTHEEAFRRFKITDTMLTKYGYTDQCDACMRKERGSLIQGRHSESCRKRIQDLLMNDETGKGVIENQQERMKQHIERLHQAPITQHRSDDDAVVAPRAKEDHQQSTINCIADHAS